MSWIKIEDESGEIHIIHKDNIRYITVNKRLHKEGGVCLKKDVNLYPMTTSPPLINLFLEDSEIRELLQFFEIDFHIRDEVVPYPTKTTKVETN